MDFDSSYLRRRQATRDAETASALDELAKAAQAASGKNVISDSTTAEFARDFGTDTPPGTAPQQTAKPDNGKTKRDVAAVLHVLDIPGSAVRSMILKSLGKMGPDSGKVTDLPTDEFLQKLGYSAEALAASPIMAGIAGIAVGTATDPLGGGPQGVAGGVGKSAAKTAGKLATGAAKGAEKVVEVATAEAAQAAATEFVTKLPPKLNPLALSPRYKTEPLQQIPIDQIVYNDLEHAGPVDLKKVDTIAEKLRESPEKFPALSLERLPDGRYNATDGRHRLEAAKKNGYTSVTAEVTVLRENPETKINLAKIQSVDDVTAQVNKIAERNGGGKAGDPPGPTAPPASPDGGKPEGFRVGQKPLPDETVREVAASLGLTPEQLLERQRGMNLDVEHMDAYNLMLAESLANIKESAAAFKAGKISGDELYKSLSRFELVDRSHSYAGTEAAQALRIRGRQDIREARAFGDTLNERMANLAGAVPDPAVLADMIEKAGAAAVVRTSRTAAELGGDMFKELLYASMLSNPSTNIVNVFGGATMTPLWAVGTRMLQEKFGAGFVKQGESAAMLAAGAQAYNNAVRSVIESTKNEGWWATLRSVKDLKGFAESATDVTGPAISGKNVGAMLGRMASDPIADTPNLLVNRFFDSRNVDMTVRRMFGDTPLGRAVDGIGELVHYPSAMLRAGDVFAKSVNFDMEAAALSLRHGFTKAGDDATTRAAGIKAGLESNVFNIREQAEKFAGIQTFTNELRHGTPGILNHPVAKVFVPFYQTPINIMKYNLSHTPLAPLLGEVQDDLLAGGVRREAAITRIAMGSAFMASAAGLSMGGVVHITGRGPDNPKTRTAWLQDNQPYSIRITKSDGSKEWISLAKLEPIGTWLGVTADMVNMSGDVDPESYGEMAAAMTASMARNFTNKTFTYSTYELLDTMNVKNYEEVGSLGDRINAWAAKRLGSLTVPAVFAAAGKDIDPVYREVEKHGTFLEQYLDKVKSRVPGWSKDMPYVPDAIDGEPIVIEQGWGTALLSPYTVKQFKDDPLVKEIVRVKAEYAYPASRAFGVELTPQQHHDVMIYYTKGFGGMPTMREQLTALMNSDGYKYEDVARQIPTTDKMKAMQIELVTRARRQAAENYLIAQDPTFRENFVKEKKKPFDGLRQPAGTVPGVTTRPQDAAPASINFGGSQVVAPAPSAPAATGGFTFSGGL